MATVEQEKFNEEVSISSEEESKQQIREVVHTKIKGQREADHFKDFDYENQSSSSFSQYNEPDQSSINLDKILEHQEVLYRTLEKSNVTESNERNILQTCFQNIPNLYQQLIETLLQVFYIILKQEQEIVHEIEVQQAIDDSEGMFEASTLVELKDLYAGLILKKMKLMSCFIKIC